MICVIDYGAGNLFSVKNALEFFGAKYILADSPKKISEIDEKITSVILPGVGAFSKAMKALEIRGLIEPLKDFVKNGIPLLGVCLGMQMLFEKSYEFGETVGLGFIKGEVKPITSLENVNGNIIIPHMGWNSLIVNKPVLGINNSGGCVYFVHSFAAVTHNKNIAAYSIYEKAKIPAVVVKDKVFGTQFHPEKSGETGMKILREFLRISGEIG